MTIIRDVIHMSTQALCAQHGVAATTTQYDWSQAPDWANWAATNARGASSFYDLRPEPLLNFWGSLHVRLRMIPAQRLAGPAQHWLNSLEARPS